MSTPAPLPMGNEEVEPEAKSVTTVTPPVNEAQARELGRIADPDERHDVKTLLRAHGIASPDAFAVAYGVPLADLTATAALALLTDDARARCARFFATLAEYGIDDPLLPYQWRRYGPLLDAIGFPHTPHDRQTPDTALARRFLAWHEAHRIRDGPPLAATTTRR